MLVNARQIHKPGFSPRECQDALAFDKPRRRFAIADGVSDGAYPGQWARIVANRCLTLPRLEPAELAAALPSWQEAWVQSLPYGDMPWYVQAKLRETGAFSTLALLELESYRRNRRLWRVFAIGDSCVFHIRRNRLIGAHPLTQQGQFSNRVVAIGSTSGLEFNRQVLRQAYAYTGTWLPGDTFLLMTDALAAYLLSACHMGASIPEELPLRASLREWAGWVRAMQDDGHIANDDATMLEVRTK